MGIFLGIDLGTQSVKVVALEETGKLLASSGNDYPIDTPRTGFAEQDPETWWKQTVKSCQQVLQLTGIREVDGIGFSGQMHGLVMLDENDSPVYPAIIWPDQRSYAEVEYIRSILGETLADVCGSDIATGFMAASLLWVKKNLPDIFYRIRKVLLPKDYLKVKFGLEPSTDAADASGTLLFDIRKRTWSYEVLSVLGFDERIFPPVSESTDIIGCLSAKTKESLGIRGKAELVAGGADQTCSAVGNGILEKGELLITIGTGGQVVAPVDQPIVDPELRTHTFCHALPNTWYVLGATLCAGLSMNWFRTVVTGGSKDCLTFNTLGVEAAQVEAGSGGVLFLPYLIGERTPHKNPTARGSFLNLHLTHKRGHLARSIMEGVAMAVKDSVEIIRSLGISPQHVLFAGGGAKSVLWRNILASFLQLPVVTSGAREETASGAAMLSMVATGHFSSFREAVQAVVNLDPPTLPKKEWIDIYEERYLLFQNAYKQVSPLFPQESG